MPSHKNIVKFIGTSRDTDNSRLIVTEFVKYGNIFI